MNVKLKKYIITTLFVLSLLTGTALAATYECTDVNYPIMVNGAAMSFTDALPMNYNGRTMLPLRAVADALDVPIEWANNRVEITTVDFDALKDSCVMVHVGANGTYTNQGSGVLIDYDEILTCYHVVDEGKTMFKAFYDNGAELQCSLADTAESHDAAVLKPSQNAKPAKLGDSDEVQVGDTVYVVSSPGGAKNVVTGGTVLEFATFKGMSTFTVTATGANGSSGGACFNIKGELIGIATGGSDATGHSDIIPINDIRQALAG